MLNSVVVLLLAVLCFSHSISANVEKTIFVAPAASERKAFRDFADLHALSTTYPLHRTNLASAFPTEHLNRGLQSWYLLTDLEPGRRYEVRVCWPATQPTSFTLQTFTIAQILDETDILGSVLEFIQSLPSDQQGLEQSRASSKLPQSDTAQRSVLLLQLYTAADFFTINKTLMTHPPSVSVDIILDRYIWNIFPSSLLPTAAYLLVLAIGSWFLSIHIWKWLRELSKLEVEGSTDRPKQRQD